MSRIRVAVAVAAAVALVAPATVSAAACATSASRRLTRWTDVRLPFAGSRLVDLAIVPATSPVLLATDGDALFRSTDSGCSWRQVFSPAPSLPLYESSVVQRVVAYEPAAVGEGRSNEVFLVVRESLPSALSAAAPTLRERDLVWRSTDAGARWTLATEGLPQFSEVGAFGVAPAGGRTFAVVRERIQNAVVKPNALATALYAFVDGVWQARDTAMRYDPAYPTTTFEANVVVRAAKTPHAAWLVNDWDADSNGTLAGGFFARYHDDTKDTVEEFTDRRPGRSPTRYVARDLRGRQTLFGFVPLAARPVRLDTRTKKVGYVLAYTIVGAPRDGEYFRSYGHILVPKGATPYDVVVLRSGQALWFTSTGVYSFTLGREAVQMQYTTVVPKGSRVLGALKTTEVLGSTSRTAAARLWARAHGGVVVMDFGRR